MNKKRKTIVVQTRVDQPLYKLLCRFSAKRGVTISSFIRLAVEESCSIKKAVKSS